MPPQGRLGDQAKVPADSHGCPGCAHTCIGPAKTGSTDVLVNGRPALRVTDTGVHSACCGPNTWQASAGAPGVLINSLKAHRLNDMTVHCGGQGTLIEGSDDVIVGDFTGGSSMPEPNPVGYDEGFVLYFDGTTVPIANRRYRITKADGGVVSGRTDDQGKTQRIQTANPESLTIEVLPADD